MSRVGRVQRVNRRPLSVPTTPSDPRPGPTCIITIRYRLQHNARLAVFHHTHLLEVACRDYVSFSSFYPARNRTRGVSRARRTRLFLFLRILTRALSSTERHTCRSSYTTRSYVRRLSSRFHSVAKQRTARCSDRNDGRSCL